MLLLSDVHHWQNIGSRAQKDSGILSAAEFIRLQLVTPKIDEELLMRTVRVLTPWEANHRDDVRAAWMMILLPFILIAFAALLLWALVTFMNKVVIPFLRNIVWPFLRDVVWPFTINVVIPALDAGLRWLRAVTSAIGHRIAGWVTGVAVPAIGHQVSRLRGILS